MSSSHLSRDFRLIQKLFAESNKRTMQTRESAYEPICSLVKIYGETGVYLKRKLMKRIND